MACKACEDAAKVCEENARPFENNRISYEEGRLDQCIEDAFAIRSACRHSPSEASEDSARLDWLEAQGNGIAVVHDDEAQWAVATDGMQNIRSTAEVQPAPLETMYLVEPEKFRDTLRAAIDAARRS